MIKHENIFIGKKVLIYGLGKSGISTYNFLNKRAKVYLFDDDTKKKISLKLKKKLINLKDVFKIKFDQIIISPGIDITNCKLSSVLKKNFLKIYTDLDVFYSFYKNICITITGTNGKSTTAKILYEVLLDQNYDARLVGNIGNPVLSEKALKHKTLLVIEASSYQLDYSKIFTSKYSVILNISPDHLERHKNLKNYINAKFKLLNSQSNQAIAFVKKNDVLINKKIKISNLKPKIIRVDSLSEKEKLNQLNQLNNKYFLSEGNKENLSFILMIAKVLKLDNKKLLKTLNNFTGLKYRQQIILKNKDLTIINDSKSTSFASSENLLKTIRNVYWILGGIPKKGDKFTLSKKNCENFRAYTFGRYYKKFNRDLKGKMTIKNFKDIKDTLKEIFLDIRNKKSGDSTILFSPAGASFDVFKNFEERGLYFNQLINKKFNAK